MPGKFDIEIPKGGWFPIPDKGQRRRDRDAPQIPLPAPMPYYPPSGDDPSGGPHRPRRGPEGERGVVIIPMIDPE